MKRVACLLLLLSCTPPTATAQARDGMLTEGEIDQLRDAAAVPQERIRVYLHILEDREKELDALLAKRRRADFGSDVHDVFEQIGSIADELNDNLETLADKHRDLRKILPKVTATTERLSTAIRTPADNPRYNVVRKVALDALKDTRSLAEQTAIEQAAYFKEHPEAAREEKERAANPAAPR